MTVTLYAAEMSLYSGKARSYLDWKGVDYNLVLPTPDVQAEVIVPAVGRPVIPVVQLEDGTILQDTTVIIDHFEAASPGPSIYPETPRQRLAALLLEAFGDEWLVIPAMHYRWNYNVPWIYEQFGTVAAPDAPPEVQRVAGEKVAQRFRAFVPMLGINDETAPGIEASYEALLRDLDAHFSEHDFLFGSRPSIGDYGLIGPLYAHNYRDPVSGEIMKRIAPQVAKWVERMIAPEPQSGEFLPDDAVPDTLLPVLRRMMEEQVPHLQNVAAMLEGWAATDQGDEPPRAVGFAPFTTGGVDGKRAAQPYSLWMLQRGLDFLATCGGADRASCEELLKAAGGEALLDFPQPHPLTFTDHVLRIERPSA